MFDKTLVLSILMQINEALKKIESRKDLDNLMARI